MSNIFEMYPDRFADEKAYVQKLIKLFDDSRFAYECGANLINILLSTLPEAPGSKRKLINVISEFLNDYLDYQDDAQSRIITLFGLPENTRKEEVIKRLSFIFLQIMYLGKLLDGVMINITDVITGPIDKMNVLIKSSKFAFSERTAEFIMSTYEEFTGNFEDEKSQKGAAQAMQKMVARLPEFYHYLF